MRAGSGAVLLVGFALVVMLLSVASVVTPPSTLMKQDPSQDFADIIGSINEMASVCSIPSGDQQQKCISYFETSLDKLKESLKTKGIELYYEPVATPSVIYYFYSLNSADNSSSFTAAIGIFLKNPPGEGGGGGGGGLSYKIKLIPTELCLHDKKEWHGIPVKKGVGLLFMFNNNSFPMNSAYLSFEGNDTLKKLRVRIIDIEFKEKKLRGGSLLISTKIKISKPIDAESGTVTFSLPVMNSEPNHLIFGLAELKLKHTSSDGLQDYLILDPTGQKVPVYWNTCDPYFPNKGLKKILKDLLEQLEEED
jgi:hypothetical protein